MIDPSFVFDLSSWSFRMVGSRPSIASEEKTESVLQIVEHFVANGRGSDRNAVILVEFKARNAAVCGDELVLLADWVAKQVDLDVGGLLGERMRADDIALADGRARKLPDEPRPVPAGMSAILAISCGRPSRRAQGRRARSDV
jgi:hypothetical protein